VDTAHAPNLLRAGLELKQAVEGTIAVRHPGDKKVGGIQGVILTAAPREGGDLRSTTILEGGVLKRSPGIAGTVALLAVLDAMGLVQGNHTFIHEGLIGTQLHGRIASRRQVGETPFVIPLIEGNAWMTGRHEFIVEPDDSPGFRI
jgi:proline racemase